MASTRHRSPDYDPPNGCRSTSIQRIAWRQLWRLLLSTEPSAITPAQQPATLGEKRCPSAIDKEAAIASSPDFVSDMARKGAEK